MSDIELVIKIDEKSYNKIKRCTDKLLAGELERVVKNGTPLPKAHGRIGDIDELHNTFKKACDAYNIDNLSFISDVDMNFDLAHTIIEAESEGNS